MLNTSSTVENVSIGLRRAAVRFRPHLIHSTNQQTCVRSIMCLVIIAHLFRLHSPRRERQRLMVKNRLKVARKPITDINHGRKRPLILTNDNQSSGVFATQLGAAQSRSSPTPMY